MNYGLYLSATGVMVNSHRQDVIANNIANAETHGFKRDVTSFQQRLTEAQMLGLRGAINPVLENIGGGLLVHPTGIDQTEGELEPTGNNLDAAILGNGYFGVLDGNQTRLTRNGAFAINREGYLVMADNPNVKVLDRDQHAIQLDGRYRSNITLGPEGEITQNGQLVGQIGMFDVADKTKLTKRGGNLLATSDGEKLQPARSILRSEFLERSNVDPAIELTQLMDAQRQLEANANMIRYQDATLGRLVNDVGKIS
jgi:flagellar basal body rod protein FlgG